MKRILVLAALLTLAAPSIAAGPNPVGRYRLTGEQDAASELIIRKDGHFAYALAYGALDEQAEGRWRREGGRIYLTTEPKPVPAAFAAGEATRTDETPLRLRVVWDGTDRGVATVDLRVGFTDGGTVEDYTQEDGWSLDPAETRKPAWVELWLGMFGLPPTRFPVDPARWNSLTFRLIPHDLGTYDFEDMQLDIAPGRLVMHRGEALLVYQRLGK
ncbi:MAG: hypothetical protein ACJ8ER_07060 [Allosphingosinicella sp.]